MASALYRTCSGSAEALAGLYFCELCRSLRPNSLDAVVQEAAQFFCPNCMRTQVPRAVAGEYHRCQHCLSCPSCSATLSVRARAPSHTSPSYELLCKYCGWSSGMALGLRAQSKKDLLADAAHMARPTGPGDAVRAAAEPLLAAQRQALAERRQLVGALHASDRVRQQRGSPARHATSPWTSPASVSSLLSPATRRAQPRVPHGRWKWEDAERSVTSRARAAELAIDAAVGLLPDGARVVDGSEDDCPAPWCGADAAECDAQLGPGLAGGEEARAGLVPVGLRLLPRTILRCSSCHSERTPALLRVHQAALPKNASSDQLTRIGAWMSKCTHAMAFVPSVEAVGATPPFPAAAAAEQVELVVCARNPSDFGSSPVSGDLTVAVLRAAAFAVPDGEGHDHGPAQLRPLDTAMPPTPVAVAPALNVGDDASFDGPGDNDDSALVVSRTDGAVRLRCVVAGAHLGEARRVILAMRMHAAYTDSDDSAVEAEFILGVPFGDWDGAPLQIACEAAFTAL